MGQGGQYPRREQRARRNGRRALAVRRFDPEHRRRLRPGGRRWACELEHAWLGEECRAVGVGTGCEGQGERYQGAGDGRGVGG